MIFQIEPKLRTPESKRIIYMLYDAAVTAYCHIGDSKGAEKYFEKCTAYARYTGLEDYLNTRNKMAVFCGDSFEYEKAEEISNKNIEYLELMAEVKKEIDLPGMDEEIYLALAKAYSQRGQVHAFQKKEEAELEFRKALKLYDKDSANYKISQSYLMHYYLDQRMKTAYLTESKEYFGNYDSLEQQFEYILNEGRKSDSLFNVKYALYVFFKGIYYFRFEELSMALWEKIKSKEWEFRGHPKELIYKYLRLIAMKRGEAIEQTFEKKMLDCVEYHGATIDTILQFGQIECAHCKENKKYRDKLTKKIYLFLKQNFLTFANLEIPDSGEERYQWLSEKIGYMFR